MDRFGSAIDVVEFIIEHFDVLKLWFTTSPRLPLDRSAAAEALDKEIEDGDGEVEEKYKKRECRVRQAREVSRSVNFPEGLPSRENGNR